VTSTLHILKQLEYRLFFMRASLGFGWCLESAMPVLQEEEENGSTGLKSRKRRKLNV
jgi:hypothetical protein